MFYSTITSQGSISAVKGILGVLTAGLEDLGRDPEAQMLQPRQSVQSSGGTLQVFQATEGVALKTASSINKSCIVFFNVDKRSLAHTNPFTNRTL